MSTPPFVAWPGCATVDRWPIRGGTRAVVHAAMHDCTAWLVMVPGYTGSKEDFIGLLGPLADAGIGVVAFDQLGQHESTGSDDPADYALAALAGDVAEVIAVAARTFGRADAPHLLGHSFGGLVAQHAVATGLVWPASLIALCTGPGALPAERHGMLPTVVDLLPHTPLADLWSARQERAARTGPVPAEVEGFLERRWIANHPMQLREFARHLLTHPGDSDDLAVLAAASLPITVVWGELDDAWPIPMQQEFARRVGARAIEVPGVGHSPNAESPAQTARLLETIVRESMADERR